MKQVRIWAGAVICMILLCLCPKYAAADEATPSPAPSPTPIVLGPEYLTAEQVNPGLCSDTVYFQAEKKSRDIDTTMGEAAVGVVSFTPGSNVDAETARTEMKNILGWPDYDPVTGAGTLRLGRKGVIILDFKAYILDTSGMDIYFFLPERTAEQMKIELSADGVKWYTAKIQSKDFPGVDISGVLQEGDLVRYLRITDTGDGAKDVLLDSVLIMQKGSLEPVDTDKDKESSKWSLFHGKKTACRLCHRCPVQPLGICLFVWLGLTLLPFVLAFAIHTFNKIRKKIRKWKKRKQMRIVYSKNRKPGQKR